MVISQNKNIAPVRYVKEVRRSGPITDVGSKLMGSINNLLVILHAFNNKR